MLHFDSESFDFGYIRSRCKLLLVSEKIVNLTGQTLF